nr:unnamed protein product [Callosobruchus analis]
MSGLLL